jgi:hypothetical protein
MSTVNGVINHGVTLGTPNYISPLTVTTTGYISNAGVGSAIYGTYGTVVNEGKLTASGLSIFGKYSGIEIYGNGSVDNTGTIIAESNGIAIYGIGSVTNSGSVSGQQWGVAGRTGFLSVTNTGTIYGVDDGVNLFSGGSVTNSLTIIGFQGVAISGGAGTVDNTGSIVGTYQTGIALSAGGSVTNSAGGVIYGGGPYTGVYITGGAGTVTNGGTINGYAGVVFAGTYNDTVVDSGTIIGRGGTAVTFAGGNDLLQLQPGSLDLQGVVDGGGGTNTLELASAASIGTLTGVGADFVNFSKGTVDTGARWVLAGSNTFDSSFTLTASGTLTDSGTLVNDGSIAVGLGTHLYLAPGGYFLNGATGRLTGIPGHITGSEGPAITGLTGGVSTVVNLGTIADTQFNVGIKLQAGGTITNGSPTDTSALLYGYFGVLVLGAAGTVSNFATIESNPTGGGAGISMSAGGVVTNGASGSTVALISGVTSGVKVSGVTGTVTNYGTVTGSNFGIDLAGGGTITDAGKVVGGTDAIGFGVGNDLLVLENGYTISGAISAAGSGNVVELLGSASAPVSANYNSLDLSGFQTVAFAPGASNYANLVITNNTSLPGTIADFIGFHDTIDLTTLSDAGNDASTSFNTLTDVLTVTGDSGSVGLQLDSENYTGVHWTANNDGADGTDVTVLCFCAGTRIATPTGEVAVERLAAGDLVLTLDGRPLPIKWIGTGQSLLPHGRRSPATPVIVRAGALGNDVPRRDLRLTKGHSLYLETVLIPVENLINHRTILWDDKARRVVVYHLELDSHEVLLANGAPAESYRDDGNRVQFQNVNPDWDLAPVPEPFAPIVTDGPVVAALWQRLLRRARPRAPIPMTEDPDLHLLVDGARVAPSVMRHGIYAFEITAGAVDVAIASRSAIPAELGVNNDQRQLGVAVQRIVLHQPGGKLEIDAVSTTLEAGFQPYEAAGSFRWTDGAGLIPPAALNVFAPGQPLNIEVYVACTARYRAPGRQQRSVKPALAA